MDCTTQLGMLRERRQRGQALLAGQRVVLCSPSWPLLVSQSTALQGGADVVAACTTEAEASRHVQQRRPHLLISHDQLQQGSGISLVSHCKQVQPSLQTLLIVSRPQHFPWRQMLSLGVDAACSSERLGRGVLLQALEHLQEDGTCFIDPALKRVNAQRHPHLSPRQQQVLEGLQSQHSLAELAQELGVAHSTLKGYVRELYEKLEVPSRHLAVHKGRQLGLLQAD